MQFLSGSQAVSMHMGQTLTLTLSLFKKEREALGGTV